MPSELLTFAEVAGVLRCSVRSVQRLISEGRIRTVSPTPGRRRVERRELDAYLASLRRAA